MAAKKTATKKTATTNSAKASTTPKRKAAAPKAANTPASDSSTKTKPAAKAPAKKPLKLSDAQEKILGLIDAAGDTGYTPAQKTELRSIEKLRELKLVKRGAKDKASGSYPYMTTAAGKKHLAAKAAE
ncbi:hypothetical protein [Tautonia sociabilis]|uniref:hypothetical protein n=1 Tax=Tautonia sociabilis TaxID=2080755 RepID=UPI001315215B|nr:hypothetical protein [Tautonia sociabilis]